MSIFSIPVCGWYTSPGSSTERRTYPVSTLMPSISRKRLHTHLKTTIEHYWQVKEAYRFCLCLIYRSVILKFTNETTRGSTIVISQDSGSNFLTLLYVLVFTIFNKQLIIFLQVWAIQQEPTASTTIPIPLQLVLLMPHISGINIRSWFVLFASKDRQNNTALISFWNFISASPVLYSIILLCLHSIIVSDPEKDNPSRLSVISSTTRRSKPTLQFL